MSAGRGVLVVDEELLQPVRAAGVDEHDILVSTSLAPGPDVVAHLPAQQGVAAFDAQARRRLTELPATTRANSSGL